jgi:hypothetical protein
MISLGRIRHIAPSVALAACAIAPAFPVSATQQAPIPSKRHSTFILLASTYEFGLPYPQKRIPLTDWLGFGLEKCRLQATPLEIINGADVGPQGQDISILVHGVGLPTGPYECATRLQEEKLSRDDPNIEIGRYWTYRFRGNTVSVAPRPVGGRIRVDLHIDGSSQSLLKPGPDVHLSDLDVMALGDFDHDGKPDLVLRIHLWGGGEKEHLILYLSRLAAPGQLVGEAASYAQIP